MSPWGAPELAMFCTLALVAWGVWMGWMIVDGGVIASALDEEDDAPKE